MAGTVVGKILMPKKKRELPVRNPGFVRRKPNPIMPTLPWDPRRYMVVMLEGEIPEEAKTPPPQPVELLLVGESFEVPLFAVQVGRQVKLINKGRQSPSLRSKQLPTIAKTCAPLGSDVDCKFKLSKALQVIEITAKHNPHLHGKVIGMPHSLFSLVDKAGNYTIENVPKGDWKISIWYDGHVISGVSNVSVPKTRRRRKPRTVTVKPYQLPDSLKPKTK